MRILFLNQYFPPDPAPTGILFAEVAEALRSRGHEIRFVDAGNEYRAGQRQSGRMRRELSALLRILWEGAMGPRPDIVVSGSSPPCLAFVAQLVASRHGARSIHWCMDLYPDIAIALGEIPDGWLARLIGRAMGWSYRHTSVVVGLDADMSQRLSEHGVSPKTIRPWVIVGQGSGGSDAPNISAPRNSEVEWTWLYSGNLGRAHEWETLLDAQALLERENAGVRLVFQGGGPSWAAARAKSEALGLRRIEWRTYASEAELRASLLDAECLIVSQKSSVRGMLWPSKLSLLLSLPRPILFVGPDQGAIVRALVDLPHAGIFSPGDVRGVADWLVRLKNNGIAVAPENVIDAAAHRSASIDEWVGLIESSATPPTKVG